MTVIGLLGGVAAGKSAVAAELERHGAARLDADVIAHEVLGEDEVVATLVGRFGEGILNEDGGVDRRALSTLVFEDGDALSFLESVVHPEIRRQIMRALENAPAGSVVVLDAALLLENGLDAICDVIVMVESERATRARRAVADRGWSEGEVARRERHQRPVEEKRRRADIVIENDGSPQDLRREVETLWTRLGAFRGRG